MTIELFASEKKCLDKKVAIIGLLVALSVITFLISGAIPAEYKALKIIILGGGATLSISVLGTAIYYANSNKAIPLQTPYVVEKENLVKPYTPEQTPPKVMSNYYSFPQPLEDVAL